MYSYIKQLIIESSLIKTYLRTRLILKDLADFQNCIRTFSYCSGRIGSFLLVRLSRRERVRRRVSDSPDNGGHEGASLRARCAVFDAVLRTNGARLDAAVTSAKCFVVINNILVKKFFINHGVVRINIQDSLEAYARASSTFRLEL